MIFSDDYAGKSATQFISDADSWLRGTAAHAAGSVASEKFDDVLQEGRIALWQAYVENEGNPDRIAFSMQRAKRRIYQIARGDKPIGGSEGRHYEPKNSVSVQALVADSETGFSDEDVYGFFGAVDSLGDVDLAYHHGEIAEAMSLLTENQRRYVYARFWCGIDPSGGYHMNAGVKAAREANPAVRDRSGVLWTGNKTTKGAKQRLIEALSHLASV